MKPQKIKKPILKNISIECHAEALRAFAIMKDYKYQYEQLQLSRESVRRLQTFEPVHVVEISRNHYLFFSGWFWLSYCRQLDIKNITVIVHELIEKEEIKEVAWAYALNNQLKSFHRHNNLAQLKHYFDSMPDNIKKTLLSPLRTNSSQILIQQLSHESRSAIRNQKQCLNNSSSSTNKLTIREQLTNRK